LYRETEEGRSNLALEVAWLGPWADLQRMEREAVGALEPAARRLSVSVWHFRVSALHEGPGEDRERIRRLSP
ncbi:MAG: hypothetical protein HY658_14410, partial [Actinobacteria bacterium]|nr:hypothetical protein [Actinomycetota bacterium]